MFNFEKLKVYKLSLEAIDLVYLATKIFPSDERFGLTDQIHRAIISVALNIAEGSSRSKKEFCRYLDLSRGSCYECVAGLTIARNRKYTSEDAYNNLYLRLEQLSRMISGLKSAVGR